MAQKEFTIKVGRGGNAEDATVTFHGTQMHVFVEGMPAEELLELVTPEEIAEEANLGELLKALVKKHGLGEVICELVEGNKIEDILNHVYEADDDVVRTWSYDKFASDNE